MLKTLEEVRDGLEKISKDVPGFTKVVIAIGEKSCPIDKIIAQVDVDKIPAESYLVTIHPSSAEGA